MEREFLEEQLAAGRSLEQIGALVGKHPSTVAYWLKKHGLAAVNHEKNAPKGTVDPAELDKLIAPDLTVAELAARLGVSTTTVNYWLRKLGVRTRRGSDRVRHAAARRAGRRSITGRCTKHGAVEFRRTPRSSYKCVSCLKEAVTEYRRRVKRILVSEAGGCCQRCGFAEHPAALQFHHVDPATKLFSLSAAGISRSLERARAEARKCVLLCSNCHALVEAGVASV
jgi:AcrR family transcriptional regulator